MAGRRPARPAFTVLAAISFCHLLNDLASSLLPAIYPILKSGLDLTFGQIGLITLVYQGIASLLQPVVGLYTDHRPQPYSLSFGMACTLLGLAIAAFAPAFLVLLAGAALLGLGSAIFHPESSRLARLASGGAHGFAQSLFQVGGNFGTRSARCWRRFSSCRAGRAASPGSRCWRSSACASCRRWALVQEYRPSCAQSRRRSLVRAAVALPSAQVRRAIADSGRADLFEILLSVEHHQLLHLLSDAPLRLADADRADLSVRLPRRLGGRHVLRRPDRRPVRPQARHLGLDPRRAAVHAGAALCRPCCDHRR